MIFTGGILGAITIASFMVWMIPQDSDTLVVSDFEEHLEGVHNIHAVISGELAASFTDLLDGNMSPVQYVENAETATSQINTQIISLVSSKAPEEWHDPYIAYIDALKVQNSIIRESIVVANMIQDGKSDGITGSVDTMDRLYETMRSLVSDSGHALPVSPYGTVPMSIP